MELSSLPLDLFQLIVLLLSDEDKESLSCTSRKLHSLMQRLYDSSWFWRERYSRAYNDDPCTPIDQLLPELIEYYGWRKLWFRVRDYVDVRKDDVVIGSTGNIFIHYQDEDVYIDTIPISRLVHIQRRDFDFVILYLDFEQILRFLLITFNESKPKSQRIYFEESPVLHSYLSPECHIFVQEDGSVMIIHRTHDNLMNLLNFPNVIWPDAGLASVGPLSSNFSVIDLHKEQVFVDFFDVTFYRGDEKLFKCPRSSPTYLKLLQEEIVRRLRE
jgi:hypothetical protein